MIGLCRLIALKVYRVHRGSLLPADAFDSGARQWGFVSREQSDRHSIHYGPDYPESRMYYSYLNIVSYGMKGRYE